MTNLTDLKNRLTLAQCPDQHGVVRTAFTDDEINLILEALNLGDRRSAEHEYPRTHGPGSDRWATMAFAIMDQMRPGAMTVRDRFMLAGMLAGALAEMHEIGQREGRNAQSP